MFVSAQWKSIARFGTGGLMSVCNLPLVEKLSIVLPVTSLDKTYFIQVVCSTFGTILSLIRKITWQLDLQ